MKRRSKMKKLLCMMLSVVFCLGTVLVFSPQNKVDAATTIEEDRNSIHQKEDELARIIAQREEAQKQVDALKESQSSFMDKKTALDNQISTLTSEVNMIESLISDYEAKIADTENQIAQLQVSMNDTKEQLKNNMRASYEDGLVSYIELILSAESFSDFLSRMDIVGSIMEYNERSLKQMEKQQAQLEAMKAELTELKKNNEEKAVSIVTQKTALSSSISELDGYLTSIQNDTDKALAALRQAQAAEAEINAELEKMLRDLQARENSQYVGGEFNWPCPTSYVRLSSKYGWRNLFGQQDFHLGIDIPCPTGTKISASNSGTVIRAEWHWSYGYYVLINHGGGMSTLYAHNSQLLVSVGDVVSQGQTVALAGNTGNSYGSHCHFEVRVNGEHKNPMDYVTAPNGWYYS